MSGPRHTPVMHPVHTCGGGARRSFSARSNDIWIALACFREFDDFTGDDFVSELVWIRGSQESLGVSVG
jgi:hypothetical protein